MVFLLLILGCKADTPYDIPKFSTDLWIHKEGEDYPFREILLDQVIYNDTIRLLNKYELLKVLGPADDVRENHYYYRIKTTGWSVWPLHTRDLVMKLANDTTINWVKVHE